MTNNTAMTNKHSLVNVIYEKKIQRIDVKVLRGEGRKTGNVI